MKVLYYGGQKSGKSNLAEQKTLSLAKNQKPYYLATYDNSYNDSEMKQRISRHQKQRKESFITIEEPKELSSIMEQNKTYLIDCISMFILNTLDESEESVLNELEHICAKDANIVFVLNNVNEGVIPLDALSRKYVDRSGIVGQKLAKLCNEVYEVKLGLEFRLK